MADFCGTGVNASDVFSETLQLSRSGETEKVNSLACKSLSNENSNATDRNEKFSEAESSSCYMEKFCENVEHNQIGFSMSEDVKQDQVRKAKVRRRGKRGKRKSKADASKMDESCSIAQTFDDSLTITLKDKETISLVETRSVSDLSTPDTKEKDSDVKFTKGNNHFIKRQVENCSADLLEPPNSITDSSHRAKSKRERGKKGQTDPNRKAAQVKSNLQTPEQTRKPKSGKNKRQTDPASNSFCEEFPIGMVPTRNPLTPPKPKQLSNSREKEKTPYNVGGHGNSKPGKSSPKSLRKKYKPYEDYWTREQVSAGLKRGLLVKGAIRISQRNYEVAWVSVAGIHRDVVVDGMMNRNRALHGDVVALQILPREQWKVDQEQYDEALLEEEIARNKTITQNIVEQDVIVNNSLQSSEDNEPILLHADKTPTKLKSCYLSEMKEIPDKFLQQTAKVVYIVEKKHTRVGSGFLKPLKKHSDSDALFSPTDSRLPRIRISHDCCPSGFFDRPNDFVKTLFIARITSWPSTAPLDSFLARGTISRSLGEAGEIEPETEAILMEYAIDTGPFPDEVAACLPQLNPWKIPDSEFNIRRDFRDECVFTIDPMTARDLDDALHCKKLSDEIYEVGVHIADVSYFVLPDTALDNVALQRGTSTYMVQKVIPMLPRLLCEELCSLNPGKDRLCMSVVWKMTSTGVILDEWKGRGVIRSRVKMAYEHAQEMIDYPSKKWLANEMPPIPDDVDIADISTSVNVLHQMAVKMRQRRIENGALRLDQVKLRFDLDKDTGLPNGYHIHQQQDSNKLVEEFMLLANMAVAHHIYNAFPISAILRRHPQPHQKLLDDLMQLCKSLEVDFNCSSSKAIQQSLAKIPSLSPEHEILVQLTMKPMKNAEYFCAGCIEDTAYAHYALSVPLYTHFTSPIRRYPDILVHRMLAASLAIDEQVNKTSEELDVIASHCNDRKLASKTCSELSSEMFFGIFVRECGPLEEDGIVAGVMDQSFDILVPKLGLTKRIYAKFCPGIKKFQFLKPVKNNPSRMLLTWSSGHNSKKEPIEITQTLRIFTKVRVLLTTESESDGAAKPFKVFAKLVPPSGMKGNRQSDFADGEANNGRQDSMSQLLNSKSVEFKESLSGLLNSDDKTLSTLTKKLFVSSKGERLIDLNSATTRNGSNNDDDDVIIETDSDEETK